MGTMALVQNNLDAQLPVIDRADGIWLFDIDGKAYIDGCSGAVVTIIGHNNPRVLAAMADQASRISFVHRGAFTSRSSEELASDISRMTGYPGVWLVNSGSEATEAALQFAIQYHRETGHPERTHFLAHRHGYHGNTLGGLSLSGHGRRSVAAGIVQPWPTLPTPHFFREAAGRDEAQFTADLLAGARAELERTKGTIAGIVLEAIGGATLGVVMPPDGYLQGMRALCDEYGVLLVIDEVMTSIGRVGTVLGADHWGVRADISVVGKGLGAGYTPIAAVLISEMVLDAIGSGSRRILGGHTYAANPLSAAIAREVLAVVRDEQLIEKGAVIGAVLGDALKALATRHPVVIDTRGVGMMWGMELEPGKYPTGQTAGRLAALAMDAGLVVYVATGGYNDAFTVAPPLTITEDEVDELVSRLDTALTALAAEVGVTALAGVGGGK